MILSVRWAETQGNSFTLGGGTVTVLEGALSGIGDIGGDVNNEGGTISPGGSPNNSAVPEPQTLGLVILGLLLLVAARWKLFVLSAPSAKLSTSGTTAIPSIDAYKIRIRTGTVYEVHEELIA